MLPELITDPKTSPWSPCSSAALATGRREPTLLGLTRGLAKELGSHNCRGCSLFFLIFLDLSLRGTWPAGLTVVSHCQGPRVYLIGVAVPCWLHQPEPTTSQGRSPAPCCQLPCTSQERFAGQLSTQPGPSAGAVPLPGQSSTSAANWAPGGRACASHLEGSQAELGSKHCVSRSG